MIKKAFFYIFMTLSLIAKAEPLKIAVIDTGIDNRDLWDKTTMDKLGLVKPKLCKTGHKSYVDDSIHDNHGHGTHIAGLIAKNNQDLDYCLVILKYYNPEKFGIRMTPLNASIQALKDAIDLDVDVINYSGGGIDRNKEECDLAKKALNKGIKLNFAAGNEQTNLTFKKNRNEKIKNENMHLGYYPAMCDPRINVIASLDSNGLILNSSNFIHEFEVASKSSQGILKIKSNGRFEYIPKNKSKVMNEVFKLKILTASYKIKNVENEKNNPEMSILLDFSARNPATSKIKKNKNSVEKSTLINLTIYPIKNEILGIYEGQILLNNKIIDELGIVDNFLPNFHYELGHEMLSLGKDGEIIEMTGTSQATAIFTSKQVNEILSFRNLASEKKNK